MTQPVAALVGSSAVVGLRPDRFATTGIFLANGLGIGAWAAAIPRFKEEMALTDAQLSVVLLAFAVGAVAAMPAAGILGSRVRTGVATWIAGLAFTVALTLPVLVPSLTILCAAVILIGAGNGAVDVLMNAHASGIERRWGKPIMSSFHAGFSIGGVFGAVIGGWLGAIDSSAGLYVPSVIGSVLVLCAARFLRCPGSVSSSAPLRAPSRALLALCLLALLCMMIEGAVADWSGTYLAQSAVPMELVATGYATFSGCMVVGRLLGDGLVARLSPAGVVRVGGLLAMVGLLVIVVAPGLISGAIGLGLVGLGLANVVPVAFSTAARSGPSPAAGVSMAATAGYVGFLVGPVAIGAVASVSSLRWGMALLAAAAAAVGALSLARQLRP